MNFNSVVFLFCFMPLALGLYYLVPGRVKNAVLLVESLLFFCWGGITWLPLAVGMVAINYAAGVFCLPACPPGASEKIVLIAAIVLTAAALVLLAKIHETFFAWTRSTLSLPPGLPS